MSRLSLIVSATILGGAISSQAATIAYSGLQGQATGLLGANVNDGTGWGGSWDPQNVNAGHNIANTTPLTFGSLATSADGNYISGGGNYTNIGRRLATGNGGAFQSAGYVSDPWTLATVDTGTVWFSVLARVNSATTGLYLQLHDQNISWNSGTAGNAIQIGRNGSTWSAELAGGTYAASTAPVVANQTVLLVGRYGFAGANSSFHFWALSDPSAAGLGGPDLSLSSANVAITGVAGTAIDFKSFKAYLDNGGANRAQIDEIRFGTDYASVTPLVPEPATIGIVLGSASMLLVRRRK